MSVQEIARAILEIDSVDEESLREWATAESEAFEAYSAGLEIEMVCKGCHGG